MKINSLETYNSHSKLKINKINFDNFTLLVGASGVGKTQVLRSLTALKSIANGDARSGLKWIIGFTVSDDEYFWSGEFEALSDFDAIMDSLPFISSDDDEKPKPRILSELITKNGLEVINRNGDEIIFNSARTVKLSSTESVVNLLREEDDISIVHNAFDAIVFIDPDEGLGFFTNRNKHLDESKPHTMNDIRETSFSLSGKLYLCQQLQPTYFGMIVNAFKEVFSYVEDVKMEKVDAKDIPYFFGGMYVIKVKERGVEQWIANSAMSTGMLKTFIQIAYLHLSPPGTVFLIDEFENGFGVNCINDITDILLEQGNDVQFIITSHHPYIINNIPLDYWKIISRKAGVVDNFIASYFNLQESNHEAFTKLINLNVYVDGADK